MPGFARRAALWVVPACSIAAFLPVLIFWRDFVWLFFFHDDWMMLDGADRLGTARWLLDPFAGEGIFPLYKLLWLGALRLTGGSYFGLILIQWVTHAAICLLFGWLLVRFRLPTPAAAFAVLTFGLAWTNIETLGWFIQWSPQLSILFFFAAWHLLLTKNDSIARTLACLACLAACVLCSTRGIVFGAALAFFVLIRGKRAVRLRLCLVCLAPAITMSVVMWLYAPHHHAAAGRAALYAARYLLLNPLYDPLPFLRLKFEAATLLIFGLTKALILVWAFRKTAPAARPMLWALMALDLIIAISLGYARESTGFATATGSRYQYLSLLCFAPMAGILVARLRPAPSLAITILVVLGLVQPWKRHIEQWTTERGKFQRQAIERNSPAESFDPSEITAARARELIARYGLR